MGGLNTSLNIGIQALQATQGALAATSNNIANANTPGYTRQIPEFSENQETISGSQVSGGGITLDGLQSIRDELLNVQIQRQTSLQAGYDAQSSTLQQIQTSFSSASGTDIASALSAFSSSLSQLSANPSNTSAQQGVLSSGQNLASAFNSTSDTLTVAQSYADGKVASVVPQINALTSKIAQLNGQLSQSWSTSQNGGSVEDQRDELVQQLSALTGISISQSSDGETITTGSGTPLVVGAQNFTLQTTTGSSGMKQVRDSEGNDITGSLQGGQLGGAIAVRDQIIPSMASQLGTLATQVGTSFNAAQALGFDSNGNVGQNFFTVPTNLVDAASKISVAISDASLVAASSDGSVGSNGNITNLTAALTGDPGSGQSPAQAYASLVFAVGAAASNASSESTAAGLSLQQLNNLQGSVSAVDTNEEATNLLRFQTAYEAAARIISTIQQLNAVALNMGTSGGY